jgi:hypothetical protein
MRKEKNNKNESGENLNIDLTAQPHETDQSILDQIDKRNEENQALKKLLENLNSSLPKPGSKSSKS